MRPATHIAGRSVWYHAKVMTYLIGIDEAGRGPLAGPVSVGAVMVPIDFDFSLVSGVRDSKKMTPRARESVFQRVHELQRHGSLRYAVAFSAAPVIDAHGIVFAIKEALGQCLDALEADPALAEIRLDGSLSAPDRFTSQVTIIRGDDSEPVISLAAIMAKVSRDAYMEDIAPSYPVYGFETHKGYGTMRHMQSIAVHGLSDIHRTTFCSRLPIRQESV